MAPKAPHGGNPLRFKWTADELTAHTDALISRARAVYDKVAAVPHDEATFADVMGPLAEMEAWMDTESSNVTFLQYVSTDKALRDVSIDANKKLDEFGIEASMREDVYKAVQAVSAKKEKLDDEGARLLEHAERDLRRNGLALPKEKRDELAKLKQRLANICTDFSNNLNADKSECLFTKEELQGLPEDFFEGREEREVDGVKKYVVTMKYPDLIPALRLAKVEATRKALDITNGSRCKENVALLEEALQLRDQIARMMGYPTHSAYRLETRMAKNVETVEPFLRSLREKLAPYGKKELEELIRLKGLDQANSDGKINAWDFGYYTRKQLEEEYAVNDEKIKEYFPLQVVTERMLALYEKVLGLKIQQVSGETWHEDVTCYEVTDAKDGSFVGTFYLDLHPRDAKYTHAAVFPLVPGYLKSDGERDYPVCAMVANFSKPTPTKPSLLKHNEVVTFFHELGHVFHGICSQTKYAAFHGTRVERDFVEAPSQMLENWCWEPEVLKNLSSHYQRPDEPLPAALIQSMVKARNVNAALMNLRQLFFGTFDLKIHTAPEGKVDTTALWNDLRESVTLVPGTPGTFPAATFGHIMGGYDSSYYGYLWSEVYSADMFMNRFAKEGVENPTTGRSYREEILVPGGSRDGADMLKRFLGREPKDAAFMKLLGLAQ
ncbi:metalloendopeptidase [Saitoella coloradoensis]